MTLAQGCATVQQIASRGSGSDPQTMIARRTVFVRLTGDPLLQSVIATNTQSTGVGMQLQAMFIWCGA